MLRHNAQRTVHASIIHIEDLPVAVLRPAAHVAKTALQFPEVLFFNVDGYDDIELEGEPLFSASASKGHVFAAQEVEHRCSGNPHETGQDIPWFYPHASVLDQ